tara:strand:- start:6 stop:473 length:468 start_codon:yes stop_codon:yes gene_type:complete
MNIAQSSPLYDYWNSEQNENDENKRLLKLNPNDPNSNLFSKEPYKWENLYQSILRNIIRGDESSIKGLMVLLSTIRKKEKDIVLNSLDSLLDEYLIYKLKNERYQDIKSTYNFFNFLKILLIIFINPYNLELKKEPKQFYEKTGMFFYKVKRYFY